MPRRTKFRITVRAACADAHAQGLFGTTSSSTARCLVALIPHGRPKGGLVRI